MCVWLVRAKVCFAGWGQSAVILVDENTATCFFNCGLISVLFCRVLFESMLDLFLRSMKISQICISMGWVGVSMGVPAGPRREVLNLTLTRTLTLTLTLTLPAPCL